MIKQPHYIGLEEARQLLAQMGVRLTPRQMQRAAEQDAHGRRKLPFFIDPIERKLKIEKDDLISIYFKKQVEAQRNLSPLPLPGRCIPFRQREDLFRRKILHGDRAPTFQLGTGAWTPPIKARRRSG